MEHPMSPSVQEVFRSYPLEYRGPLLLLRALIVDVAHNTPGVGSLSESLSWGQPSYRAAQPKAGTAVRLGRHESASIALFVPCQTSLIGEFRGLFPELNYSKNRAIVLDPRDDVPQTELAVCIERALSYRLRTS